MTTGVLCGTLYDETNDSERVVVYDHEESYICLYSERYTVVVRLPQLTQTPSLTVLNGNTKRKGKKGFVSSSGKT